MNEDKWKCVYARVSRCVLRLVTALQVALFTLLTADLTSVLENNDWNFSDDIVVII